MNPTVSLEASTNNKTKDSQKWREIYATEQKNNKVAKCQQKKGKTNIKYNIIRPLPERDV